MKLLRFKNRLINLDNISSVQQCGTEGAPFLAFFTVGGSFDVDMCTLEELQKAIEDAHPRPH